MKKPKLDLDKRINKSVHIGVLIEQFFKANNQDFKNENNKK